MQVLTDLKQRGVRDILICCVEPALALLTICGSKLPARSGGVSICTSPLSVISVFGVDPLRVFPVPPGGTWFGGTVQRRACYLAMAIADLEHQCERRSTASTSGAI